jgi:hypothetical protein
VTTERERVTVDREPIEDWLWDHDRNGVAVVFRPTGARSWSVADDPSLLEAADAAREHANAAVAPESAEAFDVSPSPAGPMVLLDPPGGETDTAAWLAAYAERLAAAGRSGTVTLADEQTTLPDWVPRHDPQLYAFAGLATAPATAATPTGSSCIHIASASMSRRTASTTPDGPSGARRDHPLAKHRN